MKIKGHKKHEVSRAFKQATGLLSDERELGIGEIADMVGITVYKLSRLRSGAKGVSEEDLDAFEAAFPGFRQTFNDFLEGRKGWDAMTAPERDASVLEDIEYLKNQLRLWQAMYLKGDNLTDEDRAELAKIISGK